MTANFPCDISPHKDKRRPNMLPPALILVHFDREQLRLTSDLRYTTKPNRNAGRLQIWKGMATFKSHNGLTGKCCRTSGTSASLAVSYNFKEHGHNYSYFLRLYLTKSGVLVGKRDKILKREQINGLVPKEKEGLIFPQSLYGDTVQELRFCDVATSKGFDVGKVIGKKWKSQ